VAPDDLQLGARLHEHRGEVSSQGLRSGLRRGVVGLRQRDRLAEQRCNPVEAALDSGLARRVCEALRVAQGERRERCERLEHLNVRLAEAARRVVQPDAEHAPCLSRPHHRRDKRARESGVRRIWDGLGDGAVVLGDDRAHGAECCAGNAVLGCEFEADEILGEAVHGCAAQDTAFAVEQVAVGCVGVEQPRHLLDEELQHTVEVELARHDLCGVQQRGVLLEPALVLGQEPRGLQRGADFAGDRVDEERLALVQG